MGIRLPYTVAVLPSAARTATTTSPTVVNNEGFSGVRLFINMSAVTATGSLTFAVQVQDPLSSEWSALLTSAAITATGLTVLTLGPGVTDAANVSKGTYIGRKFRVVVTAANGVSMTYSVHGEWLQTV